MFRSRRRPLIHIETVRFQNFFSFGNELVEVKMDHPAPTLAVGRNGGGKSTAIIDALVYGLYGKPFKKVKLGQVINSITGRDCLVEVDLRSRGHSWRIRRGQKPSVFEIYRDGVLLDQHPSVKEQQEWLEKHVLMSDVRAFTQMVILGSANHVPFMKLPAGQRREVVEDLLDIQVFSRMAEVLKEKVSDVRTEVETSERELAVAARELEVEERHLESMARDVEQQRTELEGQRDSLVQERKVKAKEALELNQEARRLTALVSDGEDVRVRLTDAAMSVLAIEEKIENLDKEKEFYSAHVTCPTCSQNIDPDFVRSMLARLDEKRVNLERDLEEHQGYRADLAERMDYVSSVNVQIVDLDRDFARTKAELNSIEQRIGDLDRRIEKLDEESKIDHELIASLRETVRVLGTARDDARSRAKVMAQASQLLKDGGVRQRIVRQYVPMLNRLVNKYLAALEMFVDFHLDEEFGETIRSRHRDEFSYESFSEGERLRIDLAILFAWRDVARSRAGSFANLLVFDEVLDSALDGDGIEYLLKLIREMTDGTSVVVISHREGLEDKFGRSLTFVKNNNFSKMMETIGG